MKVKHLCLLLLPFVAFTIARGQNGDDLIIPMENDNQFPPDQQAAPDDGDILEGSGNGAIQQPEASVDEHIRTTTISADQVPIEDILVGTKALLQELDAVDNQNNTDQKDQLSCPNGCLCNVESDDFITDCSGLELTEWPLTIDSKTTKLKLQNNKLTEIPKEISALTNLKFLNASSNMIQDLALGSISMLSELLVLDVGKNRLLEYPMDLKNSFYLTKLEILNLGENDIREPLSSDALGKFTSLEKIVVPSSAFNEHVQEGLCKSLASSLKIICLETCEKEISCVDSPDDDEDDMLDAKIPAIIFSDIDAESDIDPTVDTSENDDTNNESPMLVDNETPLENESNAKTDNESDTTPEKETSSVNEIISRSGLVSNSETKTEEAIAISKFNSLVETAGPDESKKSGNIPTETKQEITKTDTSDSTNYKVGATTSDTKTGGVDKSIIGIIVAGMVVIVAGITIKKNWTSIKRKFSSNTRTPDRPAGNANGTTAPEEVPLQDKSPV